MALKKPKEGEIFKYFGLYGRMFIKCTTLSHIAHNGLIKCRFNDFYHRLAQTRRYVD